MLIIDGYNLLRAVQNLTEQSFNITDVQLCQIVAEYLYRIKKKGSVIFDGIGPRDKSGFNNLFNLEVVFSGTSHEADDVIEKLILENTAPKRLSVISSDRRLKTAAKKRKASAVGSVDFWGQVIKTLEKKKRTPAEPQSKFIGISEAETEYWLREFGFIK
ncbi:MAG: NYN domain-containing protein [Planctomycetes bacterium]|nr:NYN domain-containing protein [Planctomycetota bacterium]MBU1518617.1 NYN domain-containing protein [Planctomycetota bacterium]MBU2458551.1 NYN domain-containing protein [Planctomycetota bacterium]